MGAELARESNLEADLVIPVPDSGVPAAIGYSEEIKSNIELGIIRNHYVGRTFIEPSQQIRSLGVKLKLSINKPLIKNKTLIYSDPTHPSLEGAEMINDLIIKEIEKYKS